MSDPESRAAVHEFVNEAWMLVSREARDWRVDRRSWNLGFMVALAVIGREDDDPEDCAAVERMVAHMTADWLADDDL